MIDGKRLIALSAEYGVELTAEQAERCDAYAALLVEWNQKMNLTGITDPEGMLVKHFLDSFTAARFLPDGAFTLIDVGTGAGFPGVPLAILRPDCTLTLLDSLQKRLIFLETVCTALSLPARRIHARAEEAGRDPLFREQFDVATARAVASLPLLCEYCLPFVRPGGSFIALKGPDAPAETEAAARALRELRGTVEKTASLTLPAAEPLQRQVLCIRKSSSIPDKYPRPSAKIAKNPW